MGRRRTVLELRLLRSFGVRIVWTVHNVGAHEGGGGPDERRAHRQIARLCDAIVCHCEAARTLAADTYRLDEATRRRMHVIPHGNYAGVYPDTIDRAAAREELGLGPDDTVFLFLGRIRRYKGVQELLDAFRTLDREDARLVIAGRMDGPTLGKALRRRARDDRRVVLHAGTVPDERMQVYLRAADMLVLPYRDVLTSGSAILGMTFGLPIIAPRIGCLPETLDGCSILYDADLPWGLRSALDQALRADLSALGAQASASAAALDWGPIGERTARVYRGERLAD